MRNINWVQVLVLGLVALVVFALGTAVLFLLFGGAFGMMGPGGMHGGWCPWCGGTGRTGIGWLGAILGLSLACAIPLALLALVVVGVILVTRSR